MRKRPNPDNPDEIIELLEKEKAALKNLKVKRNALEKQIRESENRILNYDNILNTKRFSEVDDVLNKRGVSLEDIVAAIKNGDLSGLNNKIELAGIMDKLESASNKNENDST